MSCLEIEFYVKMNLILFEIFVLVHLSIICCHQCQKTKLLGYDLIIEHFTIDRQG